MNKHYSLIFSLITFCLLGFTGKNSASHIAGGDLYYEHLGGNQYEVTAYFYRDCEGIAARTALPLNYTSANCGSGFDSLYPTGVETILSPACNNLLTFCNGGTATGILKIEYSAIITLPSCTAGDDWVFTWDDNGRNNAITNAFIDITFGTPLLLQATLDHTNSNGNTSPVFSNDPVSFVCLNQNFTFNHGAIDPDGDSLVYSFVDPLTTNSTPVNWISGFSAASPISSSTPITLDPVTGDLNFTPSAIEVDILAIRVDEYRFGKLIGSTTRDMQIWVTSCGSNTLPTLSGIDGTTDYSLSTCVGGTVCFDLFANDIDAGDNLTVSWNQGIANGTFSPSNNNTPSAESKFCWVPTLADVSNTPHIFTVTVKDDACPSVGQQIYTYSIFVNGLLPGALTGIVTDVLCNGSNNGSIALNMTNITAPYSILWSNGATADTIINLSTGIYIVDVQDSAGCSIADTFLVSEPNVLFVDTSSTTATCGLNNGDACVMISGGVSPYQIIWNTNDSGLCLSNIASGIYSATITDANGCVSSQTVTVNSNSTNCCLYAFSVDTADCSIDTLCVNLYAQLTVDTGIIGMDFCINYDTSAFMPTGSATIGQVVYDALGVGNGEQVSLNINVPGKVYGTIYYDANVTPGTFWQGAGSVVCVEFVVNPNAQNGFYPFSACEIEESYSLVELTKCATPGGVEITGTSLITNSLTYWNYNGVDQSTVRALSYDPLTPSTHLVTTMTSPSSSVVSVPDVDGVINWNINDGDSVIITRDIKGGYGGFGNACSDVFLVINGADAYHAALISNFDLITQTDSATNFVPSAYQMVAADVNMNDKVRANDVTFIMARSVRNICEYPQVWNYSNTPNPVPVSGDASLDWRFIDVNYLSTPDYQLDPAYPVYISSNATIGYWRDNVPDVNRLKAVADSSGPCGSANSFQGVLLGDVNGTWDPITSSATLKTQLLDYIHFDAESFSINGPNAYRIYVSYDMLNAMVSMDFTMDYDSAKIEIMSVGLTPDGASNGLIMTWNDFNSEKLYVSSYTLSGANTTSPLIYVDINVQGVLAGSDIDMVSPLLNGNIVSHTSSVNNVVTSIANNDKLQSVIIYPNPADNLMNVRLSGIEGTFDLILVNSLGQVVYSKKTSGSSNLMIDVNRFSKGVYNLFVNSNDSRLIQKVIIE